MNWLILIIAGLFEVAFATCLAKAMKSNGQAAMFWYGLFVIALIASMLLLMKSIQSLPIGTAYAVWTGIGAFGTVLVGIFYFNEPISFLRMFFLTSLIVSVIGLKIVS